MKLIQGMKKYTKKVITIEAIQFDGTNADEILRWMDEADQPAGAHSDAPDTELIIETLEGDLKAVKGDYIIKGVKGEFYPCKPDIFEMSYYPA
jgi:hypothetical protein